MKKLLIGTLCALVGNTYAITINVTNVNCGSTGSACNDLTAELKSTLNEDMPEVSIDKYAVGIANSNSFSQKGLTSDYSDNFDLFMVRVAGGVAAQGDLDEIQENPESTDGFAVGASATVGVNLDVLPIDKIGFIDLSKMDLMVSFMGYDHEEKKDDTDMNAELSSFSVMARYQIIDGVDFIPGSLLSWGGVHLHTGLQRSSMTATVLKKFKDETVNVSGESATLSNTTATIDLDSTVTTIPVEVSTYLRAGYVLTFFGGAGFDLVTGSTDASLKANGNVSGSASYSAVVEANESDSGDADPTNMRAFAGLQFNLPMFRITAQANKGLGNDLIGVNVGAKILW